MSSHLDSAIICSNQRDLQLILRDPFAFIWKVTQPESLSISISFNRLLTIEDYIDYIDRFELIVIVNDKLARQVCQALSKQYIHLIT